MFKKIAVLAFASFICVHSFAQVDSTADDNGEPEIIISKENRHKMLPQTPKKIFVGGGLNLGFGSGGSNFGIMPTIGYSPNKYWDLGFSVGYNYSSISSDYSYSGLKQSSSNFGMGPLARFYPVDFLFIQGQFEQNWTSWKWGNNKTNYDVSSLLGYIGYVNRISDNANYFLMVGMDFLNNKYSPYRDVEYDNSGNIISNKPMPIIKAGVNFYLW